MVTFWGDTDYRVAPALPFRGNCPFRRRIELFLSHWALSVEASTYGRGDNIER